MAMELRNKFHNVYSWLMTKTDRTTYSIIYSKLIEWNRSLISSSADYYGIILSNFLRVAKFGKFIYTQAFFIIL